MPFKHGKRFWTWVTLPNGGRKRVPLGTDDRGVARAIEAMLRRLVGRREWALVESVVSGASSVGVLYDHWQEGEEGLASFRRKLSDVDLNGFVEGWQSWVRRRANARTAVKYLSQLRTLVPEEDPYPRSRLSRRVINESLAGLTTSGSTARRYHAAWSSFAKYLVEIEVLESNPLRSITPPRNNPPRAHYLPLGEVQRLVEAQAEPYRALAALREGAGVEITPALAIRRRDLDEKTKSVQVHGTKNVWRDRPVFVEAWAWPYLETAAKGKLPDAFLFVEESGRVACYDAARASHRAAVKALGLNPAYRMHDARHSFAVRCMKAGIDPQLIAGNLGHQDATMVLRIYGKYRPSAWDFERARTGTGTGGQ